MLQSPDVSLDRWRSKLVYLMHFFYAQQCLLNSSWNCQIGSQISLVGWGLVWCSKTICFAVLRILWTLMGKTLWLRFAMYFLAMAAAIQLVSTTIASTCFCFQYFFGYLFDNVFKTVNCCWYSLKFRSWRIRPVLFFFFCLTCAMLKVT